MKYIIFIFFVFASIRGYSQVKQYSTYSAFDTIRCSVHIDSLDANHKLAEIKNAWAIAQRMYDVKNQKVIHGEAYIFLYHDKKTRIKKEVIYHDPL